MAAIILLSQLYNRPVHICHVARKEEVGVARGCVARCMHTSYNSLLLNMISQSISQTSII